MSNAYAIYISNSMQIFIHTHTHTQTQTQTGLLIGKILSTPSGAYLPASQTKQVSADAAAGALEYLPAAQSVHSEAPVAQVGHAGFESIRSVACASKHLLYHR